MEVTTACANKNPKEIDKWIVKRIIKPAISECGSYAKQPPNVQKLNLKSDTVKAKNAEITN